MKDECLRKQIITYMGNKSASVDNEVSLIKNSLKKDKVNIFDGFWFWYCF